MRRLPALLISLMVLLFGARPGWGFDPERDVQVVLKKGAVVLTVPQGAHLKASFMEIVLKKGTAGTLKVGPLPPTKEKDELGEGIWHDRVVIPVAGEGLQGEVELIVTYQPCTEGQGGACYPPTDRSLKVKATEIPAVGAAKPVTGKAEVPAAAIQAPAAASPEGNPTALPQAVSPATAPKPAPEAPTSLLVVFLGVFAAGLVASLTPCVYPMIPITMAIIGAKGGGKAKGFALSLCLVLGMAVTYTTLGVVAARTGAAFGAFAQSPAFLLPVAVIFGLFALSLFGAFEIRLPESLQQKLQGSGPRKGYGGAFAMGLVLGPLSAPCVGPVIGTVLLTIAQKGNVLLGAAELFTFALGMGVLFMVVGVFSAGLPRSGDWLVRLKQIMGLVVLAFAVWTLRLLLPTWVYLGLWGAVLITTAAVLEAFGEASTFSAGVRKGFGLLALVAGLALGTWATVSFLWTPLMRGAGMTSNIRFGVGPEGENRSADTAGWMQQDLEGAIARAKTGGKLVLVDTYADWCAQCKELDEKTWPDAAVAAWIKENAVAVRINTDTTRKDLAPKLGIRSYPTVILLDGEGREIRRSMGFQEPKEMLAFLKQ